LRYCQSLKGKVQKLYSYSTWRNS